MKIIVAVDKNNAIGYKNNLLFHLPDDMKFFRTTTLSKVVVMGRKTLESFPNGQPLKNRINIVLTRNENYSVDGAITVPDIESLFEELKQYNSDEVFVIGGESIYKMLLPYCDTALITKVDAVAENADKYFPMLSNKEWILNSQSEVIENNSIKFRFTEYKRVK